MVKMEVQRSRIYSSEKKNHQQSQCANLERMEAPNSSTTANGITRLFTRHYTLIHTDCQTQLNRINESNIKSLFLDHFT